MKTKIGTEVAHVTRDSDTTFKVKRSKVKVFHQTALLSGGCSGGHENVLAVGNCCTSYSPSFTTTFTIFSFNKTG